MRLDTSLNILREREREGKQHTHSKELALLTQQSSESGSLYRQLQAIPAVYGLVSALRAEWAGKGLSWSVSRGMHTE